MNWLKRTVSYTHLDVYKRQEKKIIDLMIFSPALFQEKRQKEMEKVEKELDNLVKEKSNGWGSKVNNDKGNEWER